MPLANVDRTTLLNQANLYFSPADEELARPAPPPPPTHPKASGYSILYNLSRGTMSVEECTREFEKLFIKCDL